MNTLTTEQKAAQEKAATLETLKERHFFAPSELEASGDKIGSIIAKAEAMGIPVYSNFNLGSPEIAEGFGIQVHPFQSRRTDKGDENDEGMILDYIAITATPTLETVLANPQGAQMLQTAWLTEVARKLRGDIGGWLKQKIGEAPSLPVTLEAFLARRKAGASLAAFNEFAPSLIRKFEKGGVFISKAMLASVLRSKSFATRQFAKMEANGTWSTVIDRMIESAKAKNLDTTLLEQWKAERDETQVETADEIDLSELTIE